MALNDNKESFLLDIKKYNQSRILIHSVFCSLPSVHLLIINYLINFTDPLTGFVKHITYKDLVEFLSKNKISSKTQNHCLIQKQTVRSYLRTIERFYPEHFQVVSEGQKLIIKFPTLPSIYSECFKDTDLYTDQSIDPYTSKTLENTNQNHVSESQINTDEYTEVYIDPYAASESVKKNNIFNINKKQQHTTQVRLAVSDDFYPSEKTIATALANGFSSVTCPVQIRNFIDYNKARGSQWTDYNPIFLKWLEQDSKRKTDSYLVQGDNHGRYFNKQKKSKPTLEDVINANRDAVSPDGERYDDVLGWVFTEEIPGLALDTDVTNVRAAIY